MKNYISDSVSRGSITYFLIRSNQTGKIVDLPTKYLKHKAYLISKNISATRKSNNTRGYVYHPAIYYITKLYAYTVPKDRIYFKDLECYERANITEDMPDTYFDLTRLPSKVLVDEFKEFISYRGTIISYGSLTVERRGYMLVSAFLSDVYPAFKTFVPDAYGR